VTILRERHPFEGRSLQVMSTIKRRGAQLLLLALPDGSRSLIPAIWTDWKASGLSNEPAEASSEARQRCLARLTDLLHARLIVDGLLSRCCPIREANPADHEGRCRVRMTDWYTAGTSRKRKPSQLILAFLEAFPTQPRPSVKIDAEARKEAAKALARMIVTQFAETKQMETTDD